MFGQAELAENEQQRVSALPHDCESSSAMQQLGHSRVLVQLQAWLCGWMDVQNPKRSSSNYVGIVLFGCFLRFKVNDIVGHRGRLYWCGMWWHYMLNGTTKNDWLKWQLLLNKGNSFPISSFAYFMYKWKYYAMKKYVLRLFWNTSPEYQVHLRLREIAVKIQLSKDLAIW